MVIVDMGEFEESSSDLAAFFEDPGLSGRDALKALLALDPDGALTDGLCANDIDAMDAMSRKALFRGCVAYSFISSMEATEGMDILDSLGILRFGEVGLREFFGASWKGAGRRLSDLGDRRVRAPFVSDTLMGCVQSGLMVIARRKGLKVPDPVPDGPEEMVLEMAEGVMVKELLADVRGLGERPGDWAAGPGPSSRDAMLAMRGGLIALLVSKEPDLPLREIILQADLASIPLHILFMALGLYEAIWTGIVRGRPLLRVEIKPGRAFIFKPVPGGPLGDTVMRGTEGRP